MTDRFNSLLNSLALDLSSKPEDHRPLNRQEMIALAWMVFNAKNRDYRDLMRDCKLSLGECEAVIQELIDLGVLHVR